MSHNHDMAHLYAFLAGAPAPAGPHRPDPIAVAQQFHDELDAAESGRAMHSPDRVAESIDAYPLAWTAGALAALAVGVLGRFDVLSVDWSALPLP